MATAVITIHSPRRNRLLRDTGWSHKTEFLSSLQSEILHNFLNLGGGGRTKDLQFSQDPKLGSHLWTASNQKKTKTHSVRLSLWAFLGRLMSCQKMCLQYQIVNACNCSDVGLPILPERQYRNIRLCRNDDEFPNSCMFNATQECFDKLTSLHDRQESSVSAYFWCEVRFLLLVGEPGWSFWLCVCGFYVCVGVVRYDRSTRFPTFFPNPVIQWKEILQGPTITKSVLLLQNQMCARNQSSDDEEPDRDGELSLFPSLWRSRIRRQLQFV